MLYAPQAFAGGCALLGLVGARLHGWLGPSPKAKAHPDDTRCFTELPCACRGVGAAGGHRELLETIFSPGPAAEEALGRCSLRRVLGPRWFRQELRTCFPDSWPQHFYFFPPET